MDAAAQIYVLNDLYGELKRLGYEKIAALEARHAARLNAIANDVLYTRFPSCLEAQLRIDKATSLIGVRKEQVRILQTLLRAVPS